MKIIDYTVEIVESATDLKNVLDKAKHPKVRNRLQVLIWLKTGMVKTMKNACMLIGISTNQGRLWWKQYKEDGLENFVQLKYVGQPSPLTGNEEFLRNIDEGVFNSL